MDYKITAKLFETTYANVFNWVKKYKEKGEDGLGDKRGCRKDDEKVMKLVITIITYLSLTHLIRRLKIILMHVLYSTVVEVFNIQVQCL